MCLIGKSSDIINNHIYIYILVGGHIPSVKRVHSELERSTMFKFGKPSISMGHKTPWQGFFYPRSPRRKPPAAATAAQPEVGISAEMVDEIPLKIVDSMDVLWMDFMDFSMDLSMDFSMDFFHGFHIWYQMFFGWIFP